ncbi:hypothetical protein V1504DRAFT_462930 [Lipomyces starkeyi]
MSNPVLVLLLTNSIVICQIRFVVVARKSQWLISMQRQTNNRHLQIVQGFLIDYYRARVGSSKGKVTAWAKLQETNYNMGRAFHMLGFN